MRRVGAVRVGVGRLSWQAMAERAILRVVYGIPLPNLSNDTRTAWERCGRLESGPREGPASDLPRSRPDLGDRIDLGKSCGVSAYRA